ncbi:hypothetical protein [Rhodococcus sp. Q1]|uniref:hypothetical protein n=1 Tax=Rhodococcus sp. Q1 TaxID=2508718 RepID=UPI001F5D4F47|nr:hypothetical protein [Rhodococcus sp. Q1]
MVMGREASRRNEVHDADLGLRIPVRYRHDWALFADWCAAADRNPIPAAAETLALFLHEHPAAVATQRRRLSAINAVHTDHGYPAPGRTETVRRHLDTARASRLDRLGRLLVQKAVELPTTGWPSGLFGRRDALLLVLAATGMTFTEVARLRRGDLTIRPDEVLLVTTGDGQHFHVPPDPDNGENPAVVIYERWAEIHTFLDRNPSTDLLRQQLTDPIDVIQEPLMPRQARQPLLLPIDRWGHLPIMLQHMTAQSVSALVRAYVSGRVPIRQALPVRTRSDATDTWIEPDIELDQSYYERGTAARRRDHDRLEDLDAVFDEIADRAEALFDELLAVLDGL